MGMQTEAVVLRERSTGAMVGGVAAVWGGLIAVASLAGLLARLSPFVIAPLVVAGIVIPSVTYLRSARMRAWSEHTGLRRLTLFHAWRIGPAFLFFWYGRHGLLPALFVERAGWGDLIVGVIAPLVVWLLPWRWAYGAFHVLGLTDLLIAIGTAVALTLAWTPAMRHVGDFPVALVPLFGVGITGTAHVMAFDLLRRGASLGR